ncbi:MAG: hypothetical protein P8Z80_01865 [Pseudolabrys sp.]|jgi:hypothetical protein
MKYPLLPFRHHGIAKVLQRRLLLKPNAAGKRNARGWSAFRWSGGAAAVGGVAGMATLPAVDAMLEPCRGMAAVFNLSQGECRDGHYVGAPENNLAPWNR